MINAQQPHRKDQPEKPTINQFLNLEPHFKQTFLYQIPKTPLFVSYAMNPFLPIYPPLIPIFLSKTQHPLNKYDNSFLN